MPIKIKAPAAKKTAPAKKAAPSRAARKTPRPASPPPEDITPTVRSLTDGVRSLGSAAAAATLGLAGSSGLAQVLRNAGKAVIVDQFKRSVGGGSSAGSDAAQPAWAQAGAALRKYRQTAGLTLSELAAAVNLQDPALLEVAEKGRAGLPFEIVLRLASVIGRNDPLPIVMKLTRTSQPQIWAALESLGVGKLLANTAREREFLNILRADDAARGLDDAEFAELLTFVTAAFKLALAYRSEAPDEN